eukprot:m.4734 g.4734  ORF g.4734 m.4734 type:complete len:352 (-) comp4384_c0_seq1:17-1072(-)
MPPKRKPTTPPTSTPTAVEAAPAAPVAPIVKEEGERETWVSLETAPEELRADITLTNGQCFSWRPSSPNEWRAVIDGVIVAIRQTETDTLARTCSPCSWDLVPRLRDYFNLSHDLKPLYARWSSGHQRLAVIASALPGLRVLRQEPVECLFSFICSSNNNITRIQSLVDKFRSNFGTHVAEDFYSFPTLEAIAAIKEEKLRELGFGYRAAFIVKSAQQVIECGGATWLISLRDKPREEVQQSLIELAGVGAKVADCVALFSLDKHDVVPVDTHVLQIARRDFPKCGKLERLNNTTYREIGESFRDAFGPHAGWAHSLMFAAELKQHAWRLPETLQAQTPKKAKSQKRKISE